MGEFYKRIKALADAKNLSMRELERICGITNGLIKASKNPSLDTLGKISKAFPEVNVQWLVSGEPNEMFGEKSFSCGKGVPVYEVDFNGGFVERYNDASIEQSGTIDLPHYSKATCVVGVTGDSMHPLISSGDQIILREMPVTEDSILYGGIYAVITDNDLRTVKRLRKSDKRGYVDLEPINKDVADTTTIRFDRIISLWRVMGCIKPLM